MGTAYYKNLNSNKSVATAYWMAPELLESAQLQAFSSESPLDYQKCDIFSIGLIALYCFDFPLVITYSGKILKNMLNHSPKTMESYLNLIAEKLEPQFMIILRKMLAFSPSCRPTIDNLHQQFELLLLKKYRTKRILKR